MGEGGWEKRGERVAGGGGGLERGAQNLYIYIFIDSRKNLDSGWKKFGSPGPPDPQHCHLCS
jgi:hypothetical protein